MHDEIIDITKLENTPHDFDVYELTTNRSNKIYDHIYIYKVVYGNGKIFLTDDALTLDVLEVYWGVMSKKEMERVDNLLAKYSASRDKTTDAINSEFFWGEDEFNDELPNFLDAIEAVYQDFFRTGMNKKSEVGNMEVIEQLTKEQLNSRLISLERLVREYREEQIAYQADIDRLTGELRMIFGAMADLGQQKSIRKG